MSFDIPRGKAIETLRNAALQGEIQILFSDTVVDGVTTRAVYGEYSSVGALELMLEGTGLRIAQANTNGAYAILNGERKEEASDSDDVTSTYEKTTPMNEKKSTISGLFKGLLGLAVASSSGVSAQDENEEVYELSPFSVDAAENSGYTATSTLSGTRIRTDLKDLGAAISVVTSELMEDLGANDAGSLLSYTANMEVGGNQGNFSGAGVSRP
ncbi:MAG: TonB-dependent receptor, partial [Opitutales bacterium]|nr:TonB-dependent receptor [Opitutales bacterium]